MSEFNGGCCCELILRRSPARYCKLLVSFFYLICLSDSTQLILADHTGVVSKIKRALNPDDLVAEIKGLRAEITQLRSEVNEKDRVIAKLHDRVSVVELSVDASEQCGRRANLRIQGIVESGAGAGEHACAKVLDVINTTMLLRPPLNDVDIERCHRLGRQTDLTRPRTMIVRFRSEKLRDTVYNTRGQLKTSKC